VTGPVTYPNNVSGFLHSMSRQSGVLHVSFELRGQGRVYDFNILNLLTVFKLIIYICISL